MKSKLCSFIIWVQSLSYFFELVIIPRKSTFIIAKLCFTSNLHEFHPDSTPVLTLDMRASNLDTWLPYRRGVLTAIFWQTAIFILLHGRSAHFILLSDDWSSDRSLLNISDLKLIVCIFNFERICFSMSFKLWCKEKSCRKNSKGEIKR